MSTEDRKGSQWRARGRGGSSATWCMVRFVLVIKAKMPSSLNYSVLMNYHSLRTLLNRGVI